MQFFTLLVTILPALVAAQTTNPSSDELCDNTLRTVCAEGSDATRRCLVVDGRSLCVVNCESTSVCNEQCSQQGFARGFCTIGDNPCICTNADSGVGTSN